MKLKANFHFHSNDDPVDTFIDYSVYQAIEEAVRLGYGILALTCHQKFAYKKEYGEYARQRGLLLVPGIEKNVEGGHVILLNCGPEAEKIKTFADLKAYRQQKKYLFVLAPHPFFGPLSLGKNLIKHIDLFDGIECSWFASRFYNRNKKAAKVAEFFQKPYIATSDTHNIRYLEKAYCWVNAKSACWEDVCAALKQGKVENCFSLASGPALFSYFLWFNWVKVKDYSQKFFVAAQRALTGAREQARHFSWRLILHACLYVFILFAFYHFHY